MIAFAMISYLFWLGAVHWYCVECYPSGAPGFACTSLTPQLSAHIAPPQSSPVPYEVDLSNLADGSGGFAYTPGQSYSLSVRSTGGSTLRGVLLQGRVVADDSPAGTFTVTDPRLKLSACSPPEISVTHVSNVDKPDVTTVWTAPPVGTGAVQIGFTIVRARTIYWANHRSVIINEHDREWHSAAQKTNSISIGFADDEDTVLEVAPFSEVCVQVQNSGMLEQDVVVIFSTGQRSATSGEDFGATMTALTFTPANQGSLQCVRIPIVDDSKAEGAEIFIAELTTDETGVLLIPQQASITILDDDMVSLGFVEEPYQGQENDGFATLVVQVIGTLGSELIVRFTTEDLPVPQAIAGEDYEPLGIMLTFSEMLSTISINVTLLNDEVAEGNEDFQARLEIITFGINVVLFPDDVAPVRIFDNDTGTESPTMDEVTTELMMDEVTTQDPEATMDEVTQTPTPSTETIRMTQTPTMARAAGTLGNLKLHLLCILTCFISILLN